MTAIDGQAALDLRHETSRGLITTLSSRWMRTATQLVGSVVLARVLTPHDFGLVALLALLTGLVTLFQDLGLTTAIVRLTTVSRAEQTTVFLINLSLGSFLTLVTLLGAPIAAKFYNEPQLTPLIRLLAGLFVLDALSGQARADLQRNLKFGSIAIAESANALVYLITAVVLAELGEGVYALIWSLVISSATWTIALNCLSNFRYTRPVPVRQVRHILQAGFGITTIQAANYATRAMDVVIVGRFYTAAQVGLYNRASQVLALGEAQLTAGLTGTSLPIMAKLQNDVPRLNHFLQRGLNATGLILAPTFMSLSIVATPLVTLVYGTQWHAAGGLLSVLALAGTVRTALLLVELTATAMGILSKQITATLAFQGLVALCLLIAAQYSLHVVAVVYVAGTVCSVFLIISYISWRTKIETASCLWALSKPLIVWWPVYGLTLVGTHTMRLTSGWDGRLESLALFLALGLVMVCFVSAVRFDYYDLVNFLLRARRPPQTARIAAHQASNEAVLMGARK